MQALILVVQVFLLGQLRPPEDRAVPTRAPWSLDRLAAARSAKLGIRDLRTVAVEINRSKGRQIEVRRLVQVLGLPGLLWQYFDSRPTIFGVVINRDNAAKQTLEAPGSKSGDSQQRNHYIQKDQFVDAEIRWLGVPITCAGTVRDGEVDLKQGTTEVIITTDCGPVWEYVFRIDNQTGLPKSMEKWALPFFAKGLGALPRSCHQKLIYLEWDDGPHWRMPTKVRLEFYYPVAWMTWAKSEYSVSSWINPDLDYRFFDIELTPDMGPESWKGFLRKRE